ncbi:hypothetical protein ACJMK2_009250 [Sinanodonta woodiana]|uniref:Innexin n=1 Tax=Sinanodonta woodiana TaxID=1069815 RepID=A0ABD3VBP2_SINWO
MSGELLSLLFRREAILEDSADRLSHVWTFGLLVVLAILVAWRQEAYSPIECWSPQHMTGQETRTTGEICWNSYLIHYPRGKYNNESLVLDTFFKTYKIPAVSRKIYAKSFNGLDYDVYNTYYQWLPLILLLQSLLFKLPEVLFHVLHGYCGITFHTIAALTNGYQTLTTSEDRLRFSHEVAAYIHNWCSLVLFRWCFTGLHIFIKLLNCINVIIQLALLNNFLLFRQDKIGSYASTIFDWDLSWNSIPVYHSYRFPPTVLCMFEIPIAQNIYQYAILCELPINILNDKLLKVVWIWFVFVCVMTIGSLCIRIVQAVFPYFRKKYVQKFLLISCESSHSIHDDTVSRFTESMLGEDGVMVMKLIGHNSSDLLVRDVIGALYEKWNHPQLKEEETSAMGKVSDTEMLVKESSA